MKVYFLMHFIGSAAQRSDLKVLALNALSYFFEGVPEVTGTTASSRWRLSAAAGVLARRASSMLISA